MIETTALARGNGHRRSRARSAAAVWGGLSAATVLLAACGSTAPSARAAAAGVGGGAAATTVVNGAHGRIESPASPTAAADFDLLATEASVAGDDVVFHARVTGTAGASIPSPVGALDQAPVWSYVWPTSLDSSSIGFDAEQGIVALAVTSHPDFDDTPRADEDGDGDPADDGARWHAHWVVLVEETGCPGGLMVKSIPDGATPALPDTWPGLPILIDSPGYQPALDAAGVEVRVPLADIGSPASFTFDGVTAGLRVSTSPHDPLLCVADVFDVASGDLRLPGVVAR